MQERHSMHALQFHLVNKTVLGFGTSSEMSTFEAGKYDRTCQENSRVIAALLGEAVVILSTEVWRRCDFFFNAAWSVAQQSWTTRANATLVDRTYAVNSVVCMYHKENDLSVSYLHPSLLLPQRPPRQLPIQHKFNNDTTPALFFTSKHLFQCFCFHIKALDWQHSPIPGSKPNPCWPWGDTKVSFALFLEGRVLFQGVCTHTE